MTEAALLIWRAASVVLGGLWGLVGWLLVRWRWFGVQVGVEDGSADDDGGEDCKQ